MPVTEVQHFIRRAKDFLEGMQMTRRGDVAFLNSSALLAIHSAVSYTDALRAGMGDSKLAADDHRAAVKAIAGLLSSRRWDDDRGLVHLSSLISKKTTVAYGNRRISSEDYQLIFTQAERFAKWANTVGNKLGIEGWRNDDY